MPGTAVCRRESTTTPPLLPDLEPGGSGQPDVRDRPDADDDDVRLEPASSLGDHVGDAAAGAVEAVELVVAVDLDAVLLEPLPGRTGPPARRSRD